MSHKSRRRKIIKKGLPPESLVYTGHHDRTPVRVVSIHYNESAYEEHPGYPFNVSGKYVRWIDVCGLSDVSLIERIGTDHRIHPLALEDVLDTQQRAKLEEFDNGQFFIVHHLKIDCKALEIHSEQISLFFGERFLVSFQEDPDDTLAPVRKRASEGIGRLRKKGSDYLAYTILDTIVDSYYTVLDDLETEALEMENLLHQQSATQSYKARLFALKKVTNEFRHRILPLREAITRLYRTESDLMDESNRLYYRDLVDHVAQILDGIDNQRDILSNLEALYQAEAANRLNNVMRLLTVISTIFIPLSFIAGIYGMNFDNMPELHWRYGYFYVWGFVILSIFGMLSYFRKKGWL